MPLSQVRVTFEPQTEATGLKTIDIVLVMVEAMLEAVASKSPVP